MKKTFTILFLLLSFGLFSQEVFYIHTVNVPSDNQENFENIMTNYVTELAQDEVSKGTIKAWYLMKRVPNICLLYTSPSPRDQRGSRLPWCA